MPGDIHAHATAQFDPIVFSRWLGPSHHASALKSHEAGLKTALLSATKGKSTDPALTTWSLS